MPSESLAPDRLLSVPFARVLLPIYVFFEVLLYLLFVVLSRIPRFSPLTSNPIQNRLQRLQGLLRFGPTVGLHMVLHAVQGKVSQEPPVPLHRSLHRGQQGEQAVGHTARQLYFIKQQCGTALRPSRISLYLLVFIAVPYHSRHSSPHHRSASPAGADNARSG